MVEPGDDHTSSGRSAGLFVGPDVLDPVFQQLVARRIPLGKARREIMEALQGGDLCLSMYVAGGVRALQPMHFATKEEEEHAREEYRAAVAKYDYDAAEDAIYGTSPPGGIIGPLNPGDWGHKVTLVIRDRHLFIKWLDPTFPPESYKFAIINPEAADRLLLAVASPAHASSAAGSPIPLVPEPPRLPPRARAPISSAQRERMGSAQRAIDELVSEIYGPKLPRLLRPAKLRHDIIARQKRKTPRGKRPPTPPSWDACKRYLLKRGILSPDS